MRHLRALLFLLTPVGASTLVTNTDCTGSGQSMSAPASCSLSFASFGLAAASVQFQGGPSGVSGIGSAQTAAGSLPTSSASADWSIQYADSIMTAGPPRIGVLVISGDGGGNRGDNGTDSGSATIGPDEFVFFAVSSSSGATCFGSGPGTLPGPECQSTVTVELGVPLNVQVSAQGSSFAAFREPDDNGDLAFVFNWSFFEADGVTPVNSFETPEPGTGLTVSMAVLLGVAIRRKFLRASAQHSTQYPRAKAPPRFAHRWANQSNWFRNAPPRPAIR